MDKDVIFEKLEELIKDYGPSRLADDSGISRQGIYRLLSERNPRYETLEKLASTLRIDLDLTKNLPSTEEIYSSLKEHGAPLSAQTIEHPLPLEESLARGISLSRTDGLISSIIPYLLFRKIDDLNTPRLISLCDSLGESRTLGYYADVANAFKSNEKLKRLADLIFDLHFGQESLSKNEKPTESFRHLAKLTDNPIAKKWKFMTIDNLEHHLERYNKWLTQEK